jgi:hypothetical protein
MTSFYELTSPLAKVQGQRFIDRFSGDASRSWWRQQDISGGTATFAMVDDVNEGFSIATDTTTGSRSELDFNDIRPFDETSVGVIAQTKRVTVTNGSMTVGLTNTNGNSGTDVLNFNDESSQTFKRMVSKDTAPNSVVSTIAIDENWTTYKFQLTSSAMRGWINKSFECLSTTQLPNLDMQPFFLCANLSTNVSEVRIRYYEAWNI